MGTLEQDSSCSKRLQVSLSPSEHLWQVAENEVVAVGQFPYAEEVIDSVILTANKGNSQGCSNATAALLQGGVGVKPLPNYCISSQGL